MGISSSYCWMHLRSQVHHLHCAYWKGVCNVTGLNWFYKTNFWKSKCGDGLSSENPNYKGKRCSATLFPINFCSLLLEIVVFTCDFTKPFLSFFFSILPQIQSILYSYLLHISKNQTDHSKLSFFIDVTYLAYFI